MKKGQFFQTEKSRDEHCQEKDKVLGPIFKNIRIRDPKDFYSICMPNLHGPELTWLQQQGVPNSNIWAVERDPTVWQQLRHPSKENSHLQGIQTTNSPLSMDRAIGHILMELAEIHKKLNFIYFDWLGACGATELEPLEDILRGDMLAEDAVILVNSSQSRTSHLRSEVRRLCREQQSTPSKIIIDAVLKKNKYPCYKEYRSQGYNSPNIPRKNSPRDYSHTPYLTEAFFF